MLDVRLERSGTQRHATPRGGWKTKTTWPINGNKPTPRKVPTRKRGRSGLPKVNDPEKSISQKDLKTICYKRELDKGTKEEIEPKGDNKPDNEAPKSQKEK